MILLPFEMLKKTKTQYVFNVNPSLAKIIHILILISYIQK